MEVFLLTGEPGVGKSTLLNKLHEEFPDKTVGIIASEIKDKEGVRQGFSSGTFDDPTLVTIAHSEINSPIMVSRYGVDVTALDRVADLLIEQQIQALREGKTIIYDEVGLMQSFSERLREQIMEIFRSGAKAVLSIKKDDVVSWLAEIKQLPNARLVELTEETRDQVFTELSGYINNNLPN